MEPQGWLDPERLAGLQAGWEEGTDGPLVSGDLEAAGTEHHTARFLQGRKQAALPAQALQMQARTHSYKAFISAVKSFLKWSCLSKNIFYVGCKLVKNIEKLEILFITQLHQGDHYQLGGAIPLGFCLSPSSSFDNTPTILYSALKSSVLG